MTELAQRILMTESKSSARYRHVVKTMQHRNKVGGMLRIVVDEIEHRIAVHDNSKLREPELSRFARISDKLSGIEYGSAEYDAQLDALGTALKHHYRCNRHHPEHFEAGILGMHLVDLVEMIVDWMAAVDKHDDDNTVYDSIAHNQGRFGYDDQLLRILTNTAQWVEDEREHELQGTRTPQQAP